MAVATAVAAAGHGRAVARRLLHAGCATAEGTAAFCARASVGWPAVVPRTGWSVARVAFGSPWLGAADRDMERALRVSLGVSEGGSQPQPQGEGKDVRAQPTEDAAEWTLGIVGTFSGQGSAGASSADSGDTANSDQLLPRANLITVPSPPEGWALGESPDWKELEGSNAHGQDHGGSKGSMWHNARAVDWAPRALDIALSSGTVAREEIVVALALELPAPTRSSAAGPTARSAAGSAGFAPGRARELEAFLEEEVTRALEWLDLEKVDLVTVRLPAAFTAEGVGRRGGGAAGADAAGADAAAAPAVRSQEEQTALVKRLLTKLEELVGDGRMQRYGVALPRAVTRRPGEAEAAAAAARAYLPALLESAAASAAASAPASYGSDGSDSSGGGNFAALQVDSAWAHGAEGRIALDAAAAAGLLVTTEGCLDALDSSGMPVRLLEWWYGEADTSESEGGEAKEGERARARAEALQAAYNGALALEQAYSAAHPELETLAQAATEAAASSATTLALENRVETNPELEAMIPSPPRMPLLPAPRELSWAAILAHSHERLRNWHEWRIIYERTLKPQLAAAVKATGLHGKSGLGSGAGAVAVLDLRAWSAAYLVAMRAVVEAFGAVLEHKARTQSMQVRDALDGVAPTLASSPTLAHRAVRSALSADGVDVVLVTDGALFLEAAHPASAQRLVEGDLLGAAERVAVAEAWAPGGALARSLELDAD